LLNVRAVLFLQLIFTAKRLRSVEALAMGLVTEAVPFGTAADRAHEVRPPWCFVL
jgi:enoyl-CoA hydratase/carnithine racemase